MVYARAVANFEALKQSSLVHEPRPAVYLYRLRMGRHEQTGIAASFSVDEYNRGLIKKHEKTRPDKENDRTRHIIDTRAQSGPVLLTFRDSDALARAVSQGTTSAPLYDFTAADGIQHTIWRTEPEVGAAIVSASRTARRLYIADDHRAASAARACAFRGAAAWWLRARAAQGRPPLRRMLHNGEHAWFLGVAFPEKQTQILPYHRVVKDLAGHTPRRSSPRCAQSFPSSPARQRRAQGRMRDVSRRRVAHAAARRRQQIHREREPDRVARRLAPARSRARAAARDWRRGTDKRIEFVGGIRGTGELEKIVKSGAAPWPSACSR